jgi:hypothetical protein
VSAGLVTLEPPRRCKRDSARFDSEHAERGPMARRADTRLNGESAFHLANQASVADNGRATVTCA